MAGAESEVCGELGGESGRCGEDRGMEIMVDLRSHVIVSELFISHGRNNILGNRIT